MNDKLPELRRRFVELDILRGIAIILMVIYHLIFDLNNFFGFTVLKYNEGFWYAEGRLSAILFILAVGLVTAILRQQYDQKIFVRKMMARGLKLICFGLLITAVTFLFDSEKTIWFGILHFLGVGILISIPLASFTWLNGVLGLMSIPLGLWLWTQKPDTMIGLIFGLHPPDFQSFDYYSLFPWIGVMLIGIGIGNIIYTPEGEDIYPRLRVKSIPLSWLAQTGRYSLWIYMIHQPVLLAALWLIFKIAA